jgi:hypothetical protein
MTARELDVTPRAALRLVEDPGAQGNAGEGEVSGVGRAVAS